jgi:hypothetical protein
MGGIFISYSRVDRLTTETLARHLRRIYGHQHVWFDDNLRGGQMWWDEIRRQIMRNDIFIILVSSDSLQSKYCMMELEEARARHKRIIPILVRARTPVPAEIKTLHMVDMSQGIDVDNLIELQVAINHEQNDDDDATRHARAGDKTLPARTSLVTTRPAAAKPPAPAQAPPAAPFPFRLVLGVVLLGVGALVVGALAILQHQGTPPPTTRLPASNAQNDLTLLYDENTLTLVNRTGARLNASGLYFIQNTNTDFHSRDWRGNQPLGELAPGECVQLWTMRVSNVAPPKNCERLYWRQVSRRHNFWNGVFSVLQNDVLIATCTPEDGVCRVPLQAAP